MGFEATTKRPSAVSTTVSDGTTFTLVTLPKTNAVLGKVTNVKVVPSETVVETADGRLVVASNPIYKDMYITIQGTGTAGENAIVLGSNEIRIGTTLQLKTNMYSVTSTVMSIDVR